MQRILITALLLFFINGMSFYTYYQQKWMAPKSADNIVNPLKGSTSATLQGKNTFIQLCVVCHGSKGKGDGIAGMALKPRPANLISSTVQSQTDGALFWKITMGHPPMASYKEILTDPQRWAVVNYIRKLKK